MAIALHSRRQEPPPAWCAPFVGLSYERGARGPDQWDCWGLLMLVLQKQFKLPIPSYEGIVWRRGDRDSRRSTAGVIARERAAHWQEIAAESMSEQPGDAVVLRIYGRPLHVGVVAAPGWMLHASEGADSALERYDGMHWHNRVEGFWRFGKPA